MGSRVHFVLESEVIKKHGSYKDVRQPEFDCDLTQIMKGDNMIVAGKKYLDLMEEEWKELKAALLMQDRVEQLDALLDFIVVTTGAIHSAGFDARALWARSSQTVCGLGR